MIGRDFSYALLRAVAEIDDATLQTTLERLAEADIFLVRGVPPKSDYRFKHALIQDAAYENLLKSRRQALHRRTGEVLRDQFAATATAEPELLAHHFTQAGLTEAAIEWWGAAGQRSLARYALVEGAEQLKRALDQSRPRQPRRLCAAKKSSFKSLSRTLWRSRATLWMAKSTTTGRSRFTILPNTVGYDAFWPRCRGDPLVVSFRVCGNLAIPRLRAMTPSAQSRMRAKSATLLH